MYIPNARDILNSEETNVKLLVLNVSSDSSPADVIDQITQDEDLEKLVEKTIPCTLDSLTRTERDTLLAGSLINYYREKANQ